MKPDETDFCFSVFVFTLTDLVLHSYEILIRHILFVTICTFYLICPQRKFNFTYGVAERKAPLIRMPFHMLRKNVNVARNKRHTQHSTEFYV
jgi:hypothetical protein